MISASEVPTLLASPRGQHLCREGNEAARAYGLVNKRGKVRPGIMGRIKRLVVESVHAGTDDGMFNGRVNELCCQTIIHRRQPASG